MRPLTFKFSLQPGIKATQPTSSLNNPLVNENSLHVGIVSQGLVGFRDYSRWQMLDGFGWWLNNYPSLTK
ncbi:hypothetical protein CSB67_3510 [Enterobacter hormaechei]|nr:hypothetical protein CSB67_3510 [Enterobacter hormaechei]